MKYAHYSTKKLLIKKSAKNNKSLTWMVVFSYKGFRFVSEANDIISLVKRPSPNEKR